MKPRESFLDLLGRAPARHLGTELRALAGRMVARRRAEFRLSVVQPRRQEPAWRGAVAPGADALGAQFPPHLPLE